MGVPDVEGRISGFLRMVFLLLIVLVMSYELEPLQLLNLMDEFCQKLGSEYSNMPIDDFGGWKDSNLEEAFEVSKMYLEQYGEEGGSSENSFLNDYDLTEEEIIEAIEWKMSINESNRGRPSKVDKWEKMIESGRATLDEARDEMSDPTWYKLKDRVE